MNHPQAVGYNEVTFMYTGGAVPYPPPPPPSRRRRLIPFRVVVRGFVAASAIIGVLALLICLIYWPRTVRVAVATATLARFEVDRYDTTPTSITPVLSYNLTAVLAVSNPNRRASVYYDGLQASGLYQFHRFARAALPVPFQGTRRTDMVPVVLTGSSPAHVDLRPDAFPPHEKGVFPVDLMVDGIVRYRFGKLTTAIASKLTIECRLDLKLMVPSGWVDCAIWS
ncbi:protein YLS9-like [Panicum miliaceum]|uniref:Protein YLS9-like n=1 Tax=Panicum miliaceum TaxID=4540 RepID=A0A3L6SS45_PANMI|nr:protein YLS9-like [Panicum miliaceum]